MGVTAALAVFGSVLVASPASAVDDRINVDYWVTGPDSATVCVSLSGDDELAEYPDGNGGLTYTDVSEALTIDEANSGELSSATITYAGDIDCGDWAFYITDIYVGDWNEINFRFDAWVTDGENDVWAEGSTDNHTVYQDYVDDPDYVYSVYTPGVDDSSYSDVGLAWNNDVIQDERHAAYYCLSNDYSTSATVDDDNDIFFDDYISYYEDIVGDPIVYVYDLTAGEFVADTNTSGTDVTIYDVYDDDEWDFEHCESDREFWIEGLELGHTYEFQAQFEVRTDMYFDDGDSDWGSHDIVYTIGFDRSVNFTPLDVRQNLVGVVPSDNDGRDGENEYWWDQEDLNGWSWDWYEFVTGDAEQYENTQYTNVDVILPEMQGSIEGDYTNLDSVTGADVEDRWEISQDWSGNAGWAYFEYDANFELYDTNNWMWDDYWTDTCYINGADVNNYQEEFWSDYADDWSGAGVCNGEYGDDWYDWRGFTDMNDEGRWGHLPNFEGQAFVGMYDWQNASNNDGANNFQEENDVLEGLSNSYSSTFDWDFDADNVRATGTDSIQLALATGTGYDWDCGSGDVEESVEVEESNATFHVRALPNYGQDADYDSQDGYYENGQSDDGYDNYTGNEEFPESRLYAVDWTFEPGDYWYEGEDIYNCGSDNKATVIFDLESYDQDEDGTLEPWETLEPGTTYSIEVSATFDRINDDDDNDQYGDGNYDFVSFSSYQNSYATTYLESHVDVVSENTAKFEINLQDSHYTDRHNLDQAGYLAWNECTDEEEGVDCTSYVSGLDSYQDFNIGDINRVTVTSDAAVEFIDGDKHLVFERSDLNADTTYQVVFGLDYFQTDNSSDDANQESLRKEMEDTLDYDNCEDEAFYDVDTENGTDCYNSTTENDLYRTDVQQFRTLGAPELDAVTTVDNDAAQDGTDTNTTITLEFSENVLAGSGLIQIVRASDDKVVMSVRPSASSNVAIDGNVVTITAGKKFDYSTSYHVYVQAGAFEDEDGVAFAGNDNNVTTFTTEDKPEEIGSVDIALLGDFKRTINVNLKKAVAFETVQVWWHEHHSTKLFYAGSITLDENGDGDFTRVLPRLGMRDNVIITLGRHTVASQIVATS
ncbi:MAG: hypothetical protein RJA41_614 [Actinomycetota bacterium]